MRRPPTSHYQRKQYPLPRLRAYAVRALARRGHSRAELRHKLSERAANPGDVDTVLNRLVEADLLDDRLFAQEFARSRARYRRYGRFRIAAELRRKGVDDELIAAALEGVFPTAEAELSLLRRRIEQRLRRSSRPRDAKAFRSLYASLLRAGFPSAIIRDELFRLPEFSRMDRFPGWR